MMKCNKQQSGVGKAKMANLPAEGLIPSNYPFSATGIDCFGHTTSSMDVMVKRYGCLFTCFKSRAYKSTSFSRCRQPHYGFD